MTPGARRDEKLINMQNMFGTLDGVIKLNINAINLNISIWMAPGPRQDTYLFLS